MPEFVPYLESDIQEICQRLGPDAALLSGKTVLMTGGYGFVGRYIVRALEELSDRVLDQPCRVIVLDNMKTLTSAATNLPALKYGRFVKHDVIQPFDCEEPVDFILHMAGIPSPYYYRAFPMETLEVAISGTKHMLKIARAQRARMVFFSSSEIYGDPDPKHVPTLESYRGSVSCQGPRACYDESKRVGETLCYIYHETHGTHTNTIRPFNVYGPGMQESDYRVLPNFASRIKGGRKLNVYGTGKQTRTFCYATDAIVGFLQVMLKGVPGEAYNIGTPKPEISMIELAERIGKVLGREVQYNIIEYPDSYPADEPNRRCPDITKARRQLGYTPVVELEDGLKRFVDWADGVYTGEQ
jgi:UDP-glucuronate decarboxylase